MIQQNGTSQTNEKAFLILNAFFPIQFAGLMGTVRGLRLRFRLRVCFIARDIVTQHPIYEKNIMK